MGKLSVNETETKKLTLTKEAWRLVEELQKELGLNRQGAVIELAVREFHKRKAEENKG